MNLNRSGVPLMEIVSEPDMRSGAEARAYLEKLRSMMLFAGVSDCKMEGSLRCDTNVSVRPRERPAGYQVEIKPEFFSFPGRAIEYEAQRQIEALEDGETIVQEPVPGMRKNKSPVPCAPRKKLRIIAISRSGFAAGTH